MKRFITVILTAGTLACAGNTFADGTRGGIKWNHNQDFHGHDSHGHDFHGGDFHGHDFHGHDFDGWGHHTFFSFSFGAPLFWRPFAYYPFYSSYYPIYHDPFFDYPRTTVVIQRQPEVYVQQAAPPPAPQTASGNYWYYCPDTRTYYPYVQTCPSNWLTVVPPTSPSQ